MVRLFSTGISDAARNVPDRASDQPAEVLPIDESRAKPSKLSAERSSRRFWLNRKSTKDSRDSSSKNPETDPIPAGVEVVQVTEYEKEDRMETEMQIGEGVPAAATIAKPKMERHSSLRVKLRHRRSKSTADELDLFDIQSSKENKAETSRQSSLTKEGSLSRQPSSSSTPILQMPSTDPLEIIYQRFLSDESELSLPPRENAPENNFTSVNEPWLSLHVEQGAVHPSLFEVKVTNKPIFEATVARIIKVLNADDLIVEVVPTHLPADIVDASNMVNSIRFSGRTDQDLSTAAAVLASDGYTIKTNGNLSKAFRVRLRGAIAARRGQTYHNEALQFVEKAILNQRASLTVYGIDAYGRAVGDLTLTKIDKLLSKSLLKMGLVWHYPLLDFGNELQSAEVFARDHQRGFWGCGQTLTAPWSQSGPLP